MSLIEKVLEEVDSDSLPRPMQMLLEACHGKNLSRDRIVFGCPMPDGKCIAGVFGSEALIEWMAKAGVPFHPDVAEVIRSPFDGVGIRILLIADGKIKIGRSLAFTAKGGAA